MRVNRTNRTNKTNWTDGTNGNDVRCCVVRCCAVWCGDGVVQGGAVLCGVGAAGRAVGWVWILFGGKSAFSCGFWEFGGN